MKYKLIVTPEAEDDLSKAFTWYEERRKGLGHDFLLQVDAAFRFIERNPFVFPEVYKKTRRYLIKRFPYKILYRVVDPKIVVLAIIYGGRDPEWIRKRMEKP
ncbi:MAG: type II toxin-antitoxin system RelE/ParE family toxin [Proteobacteria bacterium]|nr:type II toxin-antitoxin system RelE/ParE family toxin [Pseudomonadota bacterium]